MACIYSPSDESVDDSDLEAGLPSPDGSDDEHIKTSTDFGVAVPNFCNKLREQTRPLLNLSLGVPALSKNLRENVNDRSKESRAKKRLFKGKPQPSSGVIERRYGYIPNPRWPKSYSHTRPYEPVGVGDKDREGIPGVVFRGNSKSKAENRERYTSEHSYQENDFPLLGLSTSDRSTKYDSSVSVIHSSHLEDRCDTPAVICQAEPQLIDTSIALSGRRMVSAVDSCELPSTSTPIKQGNTVYPSTPSPVVDSIDSSVYTSDSADSTHSSVKSSAVSDIVHKFSTSRSKKLCSVSFADRSSSCSFQALDSDDSANIDNSKLSTSSLSGGVNRNSAWPERMKLESVVNISDKNSFPLLHTQNNNSSTDVMHMKKSSPTPFDISKQSGGSVLSTQSVISLVGRDVTKPAVVAPSSTWSHIARCSPSQKDQIVSPVSVSPGQLYSLTEKSVSSLTPAGLLNISPEQPDLCELEKTQKDKSARSKNRKFKSSDNSSNFDGASKKYTSSFNGGGSQGKVHSRGGARNSSSAPRTLTLENFMTPHRNTKKKNGTLNSKNDFEVFQSRFVEQLSANPISPPKKVRPSPIKKLSFLKHEEAVMVGQENVVSDSGESKRFDTIHSEQNLKQVSETKLDECGDNTSNMMVTSGGGHKGKVQVTENRSCSTKEKSGPVFSLEKSLKTKEMQCRKDVFEKDDITDDYSENDDSREAKMFWMLKSINKRQTLQTSGCGENVPCDESSEDDEETSIEKVTTRTSGQRQEMLNPGSGDACTIDRIKQASLLHVTYKSVLRKYARRYCHYVEELQVPNLAAELYFIIQLLTCTDVDMDMLNFIERNCRKAYFSSVHNGVYFAVIVIKRLRGLFLTVDKMYLELLAACPRIQAFSSKLHNFFVQAVKDRIGVLVPQCHIEHIAFNSQEDGTMSFQDANNAHVFKCQKDNFYAFYRHYHDTSSVYEFHIEHQIQYVFDGCTPEQNSVVNLMHLARLYLDHMILCCVKNPEEKVDVLKMIQSKSHDEKLFTALYDVFSETSSTSSACPPPGFSDKQMFFKDFIETMSCPAFNEHLRNLVVFRILELNATDFSSVMDLHSVITVEDDKTPLRAGKFTDTVKTLCVLGKLLGYMTFSPYTSGAQNIPHDQTAGLLAMREMSSVPVPLLLILKQAFDDGHLCLTVPWVVGFLAMMDQMAPQLSVYRALLRRLHFIQRYAWTALYKVGYHYSGLLIVSCISWLFETPAVPEGFFFSYNDIDKMPLLTGSLCSFQIDHQRLVCQQLISWCCPYLEQGKVLLTLYLLKQQSIARERRVLPVSQPECSGTGISSTKLKKEAAAEIEKWLGTSCRQESEHSENKRCASIIDDEVVPAYVLTRLLTRKETDDLEDLEVHLVQNTPFVKASIDTTVDILCAKITHFTHRMILKVLVFESRVEVRKMFQGVSTAFEGDSIKDKVIAQTNLIANRYSKKAKESFCALCERSFGKELSDLLLFLTNNIAEDVRPSVVHIAKKLATRRLQEWANVQLGPALFRRIISREAEKCAKTAPKNILLYPNDCSKKIEELSCPDLDTGFTEQEQLSELIDKALSYGVWYINTLSPGVQPVDVHMAQLIEDFTNCVEKKMITMDFAFSVMVNFLMHLIIQYIVDAPQNWSQQAEDAFIRLCCLCKERQLENDKVSVKMSDSMKKKKRLHVKVLNLLSVYSVQWLTKSESQLETLMAYCKLVCRLVIAQLLTVETVLKKLTHSRENANLEAQAKIMVNRVLIKVLEMLYENEEAETKSCSPCRIVTLVESLTEPLRTIPEVCWDDVLSDLAVRAKSTFGCVLNLSYQCTQH